MYAAVENNSGNVPAFLIKLWTLVEDPSTDELIHWDNSGTSFHVYDQQRFSREILPLYFKHNNIASFIRQLNMYGFRKVTHIDQGGLRIEKDDLQFQHQYFQRGEQDMLQYIKRKVSTHAIRSGDQLATVKTDEVSHILSDMKQMKSKQESMDNNLEYIKRENKLLWREVAMLRQKHHKQQQIVNKLIQFLVSLVSSSRAGLTIPPFRRVPLAINDVSQLTSPGSTTSTATNLTADALGSPQPGPHIQTCPSPAEGFQSDEVKYSIESPKIGDFLLSPTTSGSGPIIHELPDAKPTILVPAESIGLVTGTAVKPEEIMQATQVPSHQQVVTLASGPGGTSKGYVVVPHLPVQVQTTATAGTGTTHTTPTNFLVSNSPKVESLLMSPKIEVGPSLEDALNFGLDVPSSSESVPQVSSSLQANTSGTQKRKRKNSVAANTAVQSSGISPTKRVTTDTLQPSASRSHPISDAQAATLSNLVKANSDLNSSGNGEVAAGGSDASLAVTTSKDTDDLTLSSDQLDLLSSDLDGLRGILQDQYKVDPTFLMELFDASNPWPVIPEKDLDDLNMKIEHDKDEAGTSGSDPGTITGTELIEYNPRDELFPELMEDNIMGDIDDID